MLPTFLPGGVSRPTVVGFPACLCLPPPWGWDAAIIAWPLTTGHFRPRDFCRNHLGPAFKKGFSVRPAPATTPIIARHLSFRWMVRPEGIRSSVPAGVCETTNAKLPEERARVPPSPGRSSMLQIIVPSGILPSDLIFPVSAGASLPISILCPTYIPSGAGMNTSLLLPTTSRAILSYHFLSANVLIADSLQTVSLPG